MGHALATRRFQEEWAIMKALLTRVEGPSQRSASAESKIPLALAPETSQGLGLGLGFRVYGLGGGGGKVVKLETLRPKP